MSSFKLKLGFATLLLSLLALSPAHRTYAHFPASDGTISAELHVEPGDNPVAGQPLTLEFILEDSAKLFDLAKCSCSLSIAKNGITLYDVPLSTPQAESSVYSAQTVFTFPTPGNYHLALAARPAIPNAFQAFNLSWNIPVNPTVQRPQSSNLPTFLAYFAAILALFLMAGITLFMFS